LGYQRLGAHLLTTTTRLPPSFPHSFDRRHNRAHDSGSLGSCTDGSRLTNAIPNWTTTRCTSWTQMGMQSDNRRHLVYVPNPGQRRRTRSRAIHTGRWQHQLPQTHGDLRSWVQCPHSSPPSQTKPIPTPPIHTQGRVLLPRPQIIHTLGQQGNPSQRRPHTGSRSPAIPKCTSQGTTPSHATRRIKR